MKTTKRLSINFILCVFTLCLLYTVFQFVYTSYAAITVDEFWFAHRIYQFKDGLPYRDFLPYKTVLGYYFLLLPLLSTHGLIQPLLAIKQTLVVLNAALFFITTLWLTRFFSKWAVFTSLILLITAEFFLTYAADIRVDMLGYWFCLLSVLVLFEKKYILSGALLGLGFLISQKIVWYIFASDCALLFSCIFMIKNNRILLKDIILFNLSILAVIGIYICFWGYLTHFHTVIMNVFYDAFLMYKVDIYSQYSRLYWTVTLTRNPLLFLLWPVTLLTLFIQPKEDPHFDKRVFTVIYTFVILLCLLFYKQVFPYYMVVTLPAFFILYAGFFSWGYAIITAKEIEIHSIGPIELWALILLYEIVLITLFVLLPLPPAYLMMGGIPLLIGCYIHSKANVLPFILLIIFFLGFIYPGLSFISTLPQKDGRYQKFTLQLMDSIEQQGGEYVAGIELIYNQNQPAAGIRHLDAMALQYLYYPSEKLAEAMPSSLYMKPLKTESEVVASIENSDVKLYVNNYRMMSLPRLIKTYLASQYSHYWASIYLYAPTIACGKTQVNIKFNGLYRVISKDTIILDGEKSGRQAIIKLSKGQHESIAKENYRLQLIPDNMPIQLDPEYQADNWQKVL